MLNIITSRSGAPSGSRSVVHAAREPYCRAFDAPRQSNRLPRFADVRWRADCGVARKNDSTRATASGAARRDALARGPDIWPVHGAGRVDRPRRSRTRPAANMSTIRSSITSPSSRVVVGSQSAWPSARRAGRSGSCGRARPRGRADRASAGAALSVRGPWPRLPLRGGPLGRCAVPGVVGRWPARVGRADGGGQRTRADREAVQATARGARAARQGPHQRGSSERARHLADDRADTPRRWHHSPRFRWKASRRRGDRQLRRSSNHRSSKPSGPDDLGRLHDAR